MALSATTTATTTTTTTGCGALCFELLEASFADLEEEECKELGLA